MNSPIFHVLWPKKRPVPVELNAHLNGDGSRRKHPLLTVLDLVRAYPGTIDEDLKWRQVFRNPESQDILPFDTKLESLKEGQNRNAPLAVLDHDYYQTKRQKLLGSSSQLPALVRSGYHDFIVKNDLSNLSLKYLISRLEKSIQSPSSLPKNATFLETTCLENRLDRRETTYALDDVDNVKLLLAVSGAGKTRMLLELLYSTPGYYFVAEGTGEFGSTDLGLCQVHCDRYPQDTERAIALLYFIRVSVCNYLKEKGLMEPHLLLLAQFHPREFFGTDVFADLFSALVIDPSFVASKIENAFPFVVIDEIHRTMDEEACYELPGSNTKYYSFFSPLVYYSKHMRLFPQFVMSGNGIGFEHIKNVMDSPIMKEHALTDWIVISNFQPLSMSQVQNYATQFLQDQKVAEAEDVASRISSIELCHGRARFVSFILDEYMKTRDLHVAIGEFVSGIANPESSVFPLGFFKHDLAKKKRPLSRIVSGGNLNSIIRNCLPRVVVKGKMVLLLDDQNAANSVLYGLGFGEVCIGLFGVPLEMKEPAVIECLRMLVPSAEVIFELAEQMSRFPDPQLASGYLDYLIAYALVANNVDNEETLRKLHVSQKPGYEYLSCCEDDSEFYIPDEMCGPNIIYKCAKTKSVFIVQVKFFKKHAQTDKTDPETFYCNRKLKDGNVVLKGFEDKKNRLSEALLKLKDHGYTLERLHFIHPGGKNCFFAPEVSVITSEDNPAFFDKVGPDGWTFLDEWKEYH